MNKFSFQYIHFLSSLSIKPTAVRDVLKLNIDNSSRLLEELSSCFVIILIINNIFTPLIHNNSGNPAHFLLNLEKYLISCIHTYIYTHTYIHLYICIYVYK